MSKLSEHASWVLLFVAIAACLAALYRNLRPISVDVIYQTRVDTVYAPPPGVIEGFNLECRWIPKE